MKRGLIYTVDAILAALLLIVVSGTVFFLLQDITQPPFDQLNLEAISMDALAVLEKGGTLADAFDTQDVSTLQNYLLTLPPNTCQMMVLYTTNFSILSSFQRPGCNLTDDVSVAIARRTVVPDDRIVKVAEIRTWYK